jgi:hypothetical protein
MPLASFSFFDILLIPYFTIGNVLLNYTRSHQNMTLTRQTSHPLVTLFIFLMVLGMKPRASYMLGKHSTLNYFPQPPFIFLQICINDRKFYLKGEKVILPS